MTGAGRWALRDQSGLCVCETVSTQAPTKLPTLIVVYMICTKEGIRVIILSINMVSIPRKSEYASVGSIFVFLCDCFRDFYQSEQLSSVVLLLVQDICSSLKLLSKEFIRMVIKFPGFFFFNVKI